MFNSILSYDPVKTGPIILCMAIAVILGLVIMLIYRTQGYYSSSFMLTLAVIPAIVQAIILVVNGNLGTAVAVAGAFSLVRFRSLAGSAKEITFVFYSMAAGLICGMGYVLFAIVFVLVVGFLVLILSKASILELSSATRQLKINIPEDLDYIDMFDDVFEKYLKYVKLERVRTTNLGSMFELTYSIKLKDIKNEKNFIDDLRCRNGNLTILCQATHSPTDL